MYKHSLTVRNLASTINIFTYFIKSPICHQYLIAATTSSSMKMSFTTVGLGSYHCSHFLHGYSLILRMLWHSVLGFPHLCISTLLILLEIRHFEPDICSKLFLLLPTWVLTLHSRLYPCVDPILTCSGSDSPLWSLCNLLSCLTLSNGLRGIAHTPRRKRNWKVIFLRTLI